MMILLKLIYVANVFVAGWVGVSALFYPKAAVSSVFTNAYAYSEVQRLVGALWLSIAFLSLLGLWKPITFSPVLLIQLFYKGGWLLVVALPAMMSGEAYPKPMATFFLVWVLILPFVIPWKTWLSQAV